MGRVCVPSGPATLGGVADFSDSVDEQSSSRAVNSTTSCARRRVRFAIDRRIPRPVAESGLSPLTPAGSRSWLYGPLRAANQAPKGFRGFPPPWPGRRLRDGRGRQGRASRLSHRACWAWSCSTIAVGAGQSPLCPIGSVKTARVQNRVCGDGATCGVTAASPQMPCGAGVVKYQ